MKKLFLLALTLPLCAHASDFEARSLTPEYSGPVARIESRGMEDAGEPQFTQTPYQKNFSNDDAAGRENARRGVRVQAEMLRQRDHIIRANQAHILKLNE